jgi:hypothetical protein
MNPQKNTVLNRIITPYYKIVYGRKTQSYLHSMMCSDEQFIELYVIGTLNGIKFRYCGKNTNMFFRNSETLLHACLLPSCAHTMNPTPGTYTVVSKQPVQANATRQPSDSAVLIRSAM